MKPFCAKGAGRAAAIFTVIAALLLTAGCPPPGDRPATEPPAPGGISDFSGISYEQMLEDYDYFWHVLVNKINFPAKVWATRVAGVMRTRR